MRRIFPRGVDFSSVFFPLLARFQTPFFPLVSPRHFASFRLFFHFVSSSFRGGDFFPPFYRSAGARKVRSRRCQSRDGRTVLVFFAARSPQLIISFWRVFHLAATRGFSVIVSVSHLHNRSVPIFLANWSYASRGCVSSFVCEKCFCCKRKKRYIE